MFTEQMACFEGERGKLCKCQKFKIKKEKFPNNTKMKSRKEDSEADYLIQDEDSVEKNLRQFY